MATNATLLFLIVLALVLLVGAASYISRGAVRRGFVILAFGCGLAATTFFEVLPALRMLEGTADNAFWIAEIGLLKAERDQLLADVNQKARDNEALSKTSAFFTKLHKERLTRIAEEVHSVSAILLGPASGMVIGGQPIEPTATSFVEGPSGYEAVLSEIRSLKSLRVRGPDDPVAPTLAMLGPQHAVNGPVTGTTGVIMEPVDLKSIKTEAASLAIPALAHGSPLVGGQDAPHDKENETLVALHKAFDSKMQTGTYRVEPVSDIEYVAGRTGRYYIIDLKSPKTGQSFTFESGKYTLQANRGDYKLSFNSFAGDVLKQLEGQVRFDLFVRGSADSQAYNGPFEPGFEFRKLSYLPSTGRGKYLSNPASVALGTSVRNIDLPNLRGEYLRGYLAQLYPQKPAVMLEGQVAKKGALAARFTDLILYVSW